jgi:drug/metabolite transporter (DMT)-like permease
MRAKVFTAYAICCLAWGSTWLVIKIGLDDLPPLRFAGLRMVIACAVLAPFAVRAFRAGHRPTRTEWRDIAFGGTLQIGLSYALVFVSSQWIPSSLSAALFATFPIWTSLFAHFLKKLESTPDGDGSLLDHTVLVYGSGLSDGNIHLPQNLPIVVAGGGGSVLKGDMHVIVKGLTPKKLSKDQRKLLEQLAATLPSEAQDPTPQHGEERGIFDRVKDIFG